MREIKFRGKRLDNGEWIYGDLEHGLNGTLWIGWVEQNSFGAGVFEKEIDPSTVGQYTGLHDKNGVEIYEGDVVIASGIGTGTQKTNVRFDQGKFQICSCHALSDYAHIEVIGNIYSNPELLTNTDTVKGEKR